MNCHLLLKLFSSPDPAKSASLKLETYSLGLFRKMSSHGFSLMITPGPKVSNKQVSREAQRMKFFGFCVELQLRLLKLILSPNPAKPSSLKLGSVVWAFFEKRHNVDLVLCLLQIQKNQIRKCHTRHSENKDFRPL